MVQNGSLNKTEYISTLNGYRMFSSFKPYEVNRKLKILSIWRDNSVLQQCTVHSFEVFTPFLQLTGPLQAMAILHESYTEKN